MNALSYISETDLIGKPFAYGGRGPDSYDCYGLVMELCRALDGIAIPDYLSPEEGSEIASLMDSELSNKWVKDDNGEMHYFRLMNSGHVGYNLRDGRFIHVWENSGGVRIEDLHNWENRLVGTYRYPR